MQNGVNASVSHVNVVFGHDDVDAPRIEVSRLKLVDERFEPRTEIATLGVKSKSGGVGHGVKSAARGRRNRHPPEPRQPRFGFALASEACERRLADARCAR